MGTMPIVGLTIDVSNGTNAVTLVVAGELDIVSSEQLRQRVGDMDASNRVVLDLRDVTFLDSTGLRCLLDIRERAAREGGAVVLQSPSPAVLRVLAATSLQEHFAVDGR